MAASTSEVATSWAVPSPKIAERMAHSLTGRSSSPITNSSMTTPNSPKCRMLLDIVELVERPENIRADDHAGGEIAEHGAHAKNAAERRGNGSGGEKHRHLDQLRRNHRFS